MLLDTLEEDGVARCLRSQPFLVPYLCWSVYQLVADSTPWAIAVMEDELLGPSRCACSRPVLRPLARARAAGTAAPATRCPVCGGLGCSGAVTPAGGGPLPRRPRRGSAWPLVTTRRGRGGTQIRCSSYYEISSSDMSAIQVTIDG